MREDDLVAVVAAERQLQATPWTHGQFLDSLRAGHDAWLAMDHAERWTGYAVTMPVLDETHLLTIAVLPAEQGRGAGRDLLAALQQRARDAGQVRMLLEVRAGNVPALALYARAGFAEIGRRKGYYAGPLPGQREDALVLGCPL